jgi:hypothetical protein
VDILRAHVSDVFAYISWTCSETWGHGRADSPVKTTGGTQGVEGTGRWQASMLFPKRYLNSNRFSGRAGRSSRAAIHSTGEERAVRSRQQSKTMAGPPEFAVLPRAPGPRQRESKEGNRDFPLSSFSSTIHALRSQSDFAGSRDPRASTPFLNHVILQARYAGFACRRINELAGVCSRGFRNARHLCPANGHRGKPFILVRWSLAVCRTKQIDANREHSTPSEGVCRSRAEGAQRLDSSTSRGFYFNTSSRVGALVANLNYCEFCTPKEKISRKCAAKNFFIEGKYSQVVIIPRAQSLGVSSAHASLRSLGINPVNRTHDFYHARCYRLTFFGIIRNR